jgi:uncharacterized membrane protein YphA (DoxX/SURF4 family)
VAVSEFAIGIALSLGLFTRLAALGSLFTYVMSGTASVCGWYALFAIVILATWRTSSWIGLDGMSASFRQHDATAQDSRRPHLHLHKTRGARTATPAPRAA